MLRRGGLPTAGAQTCPPAARLCALGEPATRPGIAPGAPGPSASQHANWRGPEPLTAADRRTCRVCRPEQPGGPAAWQRAAPGPAAPPRRRRRAPGPAGRPPRPAAGGAVPRGRRQRQRRHPGALHCAAGGQVGRDLLPGGQPPRPGQLEGALQTPNAAVLRLHDAWWVVPRFSTARVQTIQASILPALHRPLRRACRCARAWAWPGRRATSGPPRWRCRRAPRLSSRWGLG